MAGCVRLTLVIVNLILLLYAGIFVGVIMLLQKFSMGKCMNTNTTNMSVYMSTSMMVASLVGIIAACCNSNILQTIYTWLTLLGTISVAFIVLFLIIALPKEKPDALLKKVNKSPNGNWLNEYSPYLKQYLVDDKSWSSMKTCLADMDLCPKLTEIDSKSATAKKFRYLEIGCCHPPKRCGLIAKNETFEIPKSGLASKDGECKTWSTSNNGQCYDCDSCKAGFIANYQEEWVSLRAVYIGFIALLVFAMLMSCCACRDRRRRTRY